MMKSFHSYGGGHWRGQRKIFAGHGLDNTRARRTNTAKRAPNLLMHHRFVLVHVDTISIDQPGHTNTY